MFKKLFFGAAMLAATIAIPSTILEAAGPAASDWSIGPLVKGRNYSVNMPQNLRDTTAGPSFDFPYPTAANGHVHYVTVPVQSLQGAKRLTMTYRIDAEPGTRFLEQENPAGEATLSLYFQRAGDRWTARTPHHRWYSPAGREMPLRPGIHTISISLSEPWVAMMGGNAHTLPHAFDAAVSATARVGFTFGGSSGRGHGVFATAPARFTVLEFRID